MNRDMLIDCACGLTFAALGIAFLIGIAIIGG